MKRSSVAVLLAAFLIPAVSAAAPAKMSAAAAASTPAPAGTYKICAPYVPNMWRSVTWVPVDWNIDDCRTLSRQVGATDYELMCFFRANYAGNTGANRFSVGRSAKVVDVPTPAQVPDPKCGW